MVKKKKIKESQLTGFKYHKQILSLLDSLHDVNCERDKAGNRKLHMDQYIALILLYMFNPICSSLRAIQQCSELKKVQRTLGCERVSLGSLSEAARIFDSSLLLEIIESLGKKLNPVATNTKLDDVSEMLIAVDGSNIKALSRMIWAKYQTDSNAIKIHAQFDIQKQVPIKMKVTEANGNEKEVLENNLEPGRIYVKDRGYVKFALFKKIIDNKSSFVCRLPDKSNYKKLEAQTLSSDSIEADILSDQTILLGKDGKGLDIPVRLIKIKCDPNTSKRHHNGRGGPPQGDFMLLVTDRFDYEPEMIALMYKHRWAIEIFFRHLKHILGCRHLLSDCVNGIEIQMYSAIIACMLIALWTGKKPTLRTYEMVCYYFAGMANLKELTDHIKSLPNLKKS